MNIQKKINKKLDEILKFRAEIKRMDDEVKDGEEVNDLQTGDKTDKEGALRVVEGMIDQIKEEINSLTNNGKNVKDIFTNIYYINDMMQDKEIVNREIDEQKNNDNNNVNFTINANDIPKINQQNIISREFKRELSMEEDSTWEYYKNKTTKNNPKLSDNQINDIVEGLKKAYLKWKKDNNK
jgi:hypothetical protein